MRALPKESFSVVVTATTMPFASTTEKCVVVGFSGKTSGRLGGRRRVSRIDRGDEPRDANGIREARSRDVRKSGIAEELIAVPERALLDLGEPVHRLGAGRPHAVGHRARRRAPSPRARGPDGRRGRVTTSAPRNAEAQGPADARGVAAEVAAGDQSARRALALRQSAGDLAAIEPVGAAGRGSPRASARGAGWRRTEPGDGRLAVRKERARRLGVLRQALSLGGDRLARRSASRRSRRAPARWRARRHASRGAGPRGGARARVPRRSRARRRRAAPRSRTARAFRRSPKKSSRRAPRGRGLAEVDREQVAAGGPGQPEAAAADVAGLGPRHGEGEGDGDGGVRGVAALAQDADPDLGGRLLLGRDAASRSERG